MRMMRLGLMVLLGRGGLMSVLQSQPQCKMMGGMGMLLVV